MNNKAKNVLIFIAIAGVLSAMVFLQWQGPVPSQPIDLSDDDSGDDDDSSRFGNLPPAPKK